MNSLKNRVLNIGPIISATFLLLSCFTVFSQEETGEKIKPKLRLNYTKHMDGRTELKARAYYKGVTPTDPCVGADIGFYADEDADEPFRTVPLNNRGEAILILGENEIDSFEDTTNHYKFFARLEKNDKYKSANADIEIWDSKLDVKFVEDDSVSKIRAIFYCTSDTSGLQPCPKMPLKFSIKRALSNLPIGGDFVYTDDEGVAEVDFPIDIPRDVNGNVIVVVRLEEDDNYGTVRFEGNTGWGAVAHAENPVGHRTLIGGRNNAPWFMIIGINAILVLIWGYLLYVVYGLFRIKKLSTN